MRAKDECWYCDKKLSSEQMKEGSWFCDDCKDRKDRKVDIVHQGSVTVGINRKDV